MIEVFVAYRTTKELFDQEPFYVKLYQYQLLRGLGFIHGRGIVHCDLKPPGTELRRADH